MEVNSVESLCDLLARSKLLSANEVRDVRQRWSNEGGKEVENLSTFAHWLIANQYITEYQSKLLLRGKAERFFLSGYKLLERIGKGRMAGVYKAVHPLGQIVAIKVLPPSKVKDPLILGRFQREARLAVKLKHPNVVRTLQAGEEIGLHFIVMEYLEGETLGEVLAQRSKLSPAEALPLLLQALNGLQYLHEQNLVHRDLNPANLMLLPAPNGGGRSAATLKIMDIGLGRSLFDEGGGGGDGDMELTTEGAQLGDPDYLAPEQARDAHTADIRADIYSLGCVLYHMLAGQTPFVETNRIRKLVRHATDTPRPLKEFSAQVTGGMQQLLDRMMAKDPAQRFATPQSVSKVVQALLQGSATARALPPAAVPRPAPPAPPAPPAAPPAPVNVPVALPLPTPPAPPPVAPPAAAASTRSWVPPQEPEVAVDPILNAPWGREPRSNWKEHLQADGRDLIVFGLGLVTGLLAFGVALLVISWLSAGPPP